MVKSTLLRTVCAGVLLSLAGCGGGTHMVRVNGAQRETGSQPGTPFSAVCSIPATFHDFSKELAAVVATQKPIGGKLYAYVPVYRIGSAGCTDALHEAQILAIRGANLFDKVTLINSAPRDGHPTVPDADFYLWSEGDEMVVAYKDGPRFALGSGPGRLEEWVRTVEQTFNNARGWAESSSNVMLAHIVGPHIYYDINGKEFADPDAAKTYLATRKEGLLTSLHPAQQVAPSAKIYLAPPEPQIAGLHQTEQSQHVLSAVMAPNIFTYVSTPLKGPNDRNTGLEAADVLFVYQRVLSEAKIEAVRKSGLFGSVDVETEDTSSPPFAGPTDVVVWQFRNAPQWSVRVGLGPIHTALWPAYSKETPEAGADGWIASLRSAVTAAQADLQPEGTSSLLPGCKLPDYNEALRKASRGKGGATALNLELSADGHVAGSQIVASSGHKELDEAAKQAFGKCSFKPSGKKGATHVVVAYNWPADQLPHFITTTTHPVPAVPPAVPAKPQ